MQAKADAIIALLAKLALHYWRPDFTPEQAKHVYADYLEDIGWFPMKDIEHAIKTYRQNPESKFFPLPGALRGLLESPPAWWATGKHKWLADCRDKAAKEIDAKVRQIERRRPARGENCQPALPEPTGLKPA